MIPPRQHSQLFYDAAPLAALPLLGLPMLGLSLSNGRKQLPLLCAPAAAFLLCGLFSGLLEEAAAPFWKILSTVTAFAVGWCLTAPVLKARVFAGIGALFLLLPNLKILSLLAMLPSVLLAVGLHKLQQDRSQESSALLLTAALLCMTGAGIIANVPLPPAALAFGAAYACANRTRQ